MNLIRDFFKHLIKGIQSNGSFTQNFAITFSGNIVAQVLGFLFTPVIARMYGPQAYGIFALFIAVVNNISPISTLQFPTGYVAAKSDSEFYLIVKITLISLSFFTILCSAIIWFYGDNLVELFNATELKTYLIWIPIYILVMGLDSILLGWNIRLKEFKLGAVAKIFSTIASKVAAIFFALIYQPSPMGIIISNVLIYPIEGSAKMSRAIWLNVHRIFNYTSWTDLKSTLKVYKSYALFLTPGVIVINASNLMPIYFTSIAFDEVSVGHYALASGLVGMPMALLVNSSITVFLQKAAETLHRSKEELKSIVLLLYKRLFAISFLPLVFLAFLCKYAFRLIFGEEWEQAGIYASFLCIPATLHIIQGPLSVLFRLMHFERYNFIINSVFFGIKFFGLWIGFQFFDMEIAIIGYCIASLLSTFVSLLVIFNMVKISPARLYRDLLLIVTFAVLIIWFNL